MNKITLEKLNTLFEDYERPEILALNLVGNEANIEIHIPKELSWFEGHFPDQAVLPGVVQIDWAGKLANALFTHSKTFKQLSNIKFKTMVLPDTHLSLALSYNLEKNSLKFHYFDNEMTYSTGSFTFAEPKITAS